MYKKGGEILKGKYMMDTKQHRLYIPPVEIEKYNAILHAVKTKDIIKTVNKII